MVGDLKNDILVVKNVGCYFFGLIYGYNYGELIVNVELDFVFDDIGMLFEVVFVLV